MQHPELRSATSGQGDNGIEIEDCVRACLETARACQLARSHARQHESEHSTPELLGLLLDCAESCEVSARWMQRGSAFVGDQCALTATVCKSCEEACEQLGADEVFKDCVDACRRSFDTCLRVGQASRALIQ